MKSVVCLKFAYPTEQWFTSYRLVLDSTLLCVLPSCILYAAVLCDPPSWTSLCCVKLCCVTNLSILYISFRETDVMPCNRQQAVKRLLWQRKKMLKNELYHRDYVAFMKSILSKGYACEVPKSELGGRSGHVWYLPHHGVYHPRKPNKIRVVFDCSAKFDGVSLNDVLLQGPDLTNSLIGVLNRFRKEDTLCLF